MNKEKLINNIIINLLKINIKENNYMISTINVLSYIKHIENKKIEELKIINKNLNDMLEG